MSSTRRDVKREASLSSNYGSSDEDRSQNGDVIDEDEVVAASADFRDLVDYIPTMACVENSKPGSSSKDASNWSLGAHISRRPDLQVVAAGADFRDLVDYIPTMACVENSKPGSSSKDASNWSLGAHISRRPDLQVVAAGADFLDLVDDRWTVSSMEKGSQRQRGRRLSTSSNLYLARRRSQGHPQVRPAHAGTRQKPYR